ncbi:MAG: tetratricopeptide repeat protein [Phycisphaerales bacterium]
MNAHRTTTILLVATLCFLTACRASHSGPYTPQTESTRSPLQAERLTMRALEVLDEGGDDPEGLSRAESLLREALSADLFYGPAHNNLAVVYLKQGRLYDSAAECEWARKLMPGAPDPRVNLGIVLERAGRTRDALASYRAALEVSPEHIEAMQGLARLQLRRDRTDDETPRYLREIALRGTTPQWREWAQSLLGRFEN